MLSVIHNSLVGLVLLSVVAAAGDLTYPVVDTGQNRCYDASRPIACPAPRAAYFGQDAQYEGNEPNYRDNGDGTVSDLVTGLMWQKTPDLKNKPTFGEALTGAKTLRLGGHNDWRLPSIKELYSLIDFRGFCNLTAEQSTPYINTDFFDFAYGGGKAGERLIDAQYWSSTQYVGRTMHHQPAVFGVNFADGRIKGYPRDRGRNGTARLFARYVRGAPKYGVNDFVDNGDGTVTDRATGLMWQKRDSGRAMNWREALACAEGLDCAGYGDWRLPNAKELQSIVDYTRAPEALKPSARGPAIDPVFELTKAESWHWTSTTHLEHATSTAAVYIAFGQAFGTMRGRRMDVHGAGAQRSDPKDGDPSRYAGGRGPQGDEVRIHNYVRCVRGGGVKLRTTPPEADATKYPYNTGGYRGSSTGATARGGHWVRRLDRDGDNKVSRAEFDGPARHFGDFDKDRDGYITPAEAPTGPPKR